MREIDREERERERGERDTDRQLDKVTITGNYDQSPNLFTLE